MIAAMAFLAACAPEADTGATPDESVHADPVRAEPVPAPSGGSIDEVIETPPAVESVQHSLEESAEVGASVTAHLDEIEALDVVAKTPGEVDGSAVAVTIIIANGSADLIDVSAAMVGLTGRDEVLGMPTTSDPYAPFTGVIRPGDTGTGTYVFLLPEDARDVLTVSVQYMAGMTIALFSGQA